MSMAVKDGKIVPMSEVYDDPQFTKDHLYGMMWLCKWLITSPRIHKPQLELITQTYYAIESAIIRRWPEEKKQEEK